MRLRIKLHLGARIINAAKKSKGFTLLELLAILVIIGILSAIVLAALFNARTTARESKRLQDIRQLSTALNSYFSDKNEFPKGTLCVSSKGSSEAVPCDSLNGNSWNTDSDIWLGIVGAGLMPILPKDPLNNNDFYYWYEPVCDTNKCLPSSISPGCAGPDDEGWVECQGKGCCFYTICAKMERTKEGFYCNYGYGYSILSTPVTPEGRSSPTPPPPPPPPSSLSLALIANPTNIVLGDSSVLSWSTENADSCTASGGWSGSKPINGSELVSPTALGSATYTLSCVGTNGNIARSVTIETRAQTSMFKSYKGINFPWGINAMGISTYSGWLSSAYDEAATARAFDHISSMNVKTVGMWLWLDRMLVKDSSWGTDNYRVQWNQAYKANWESFLTNVVKPRGMEVIATLFTVGIDHDYDFEKDAFTPVVAGEDILGPAVSNGNMEAGTGPIPDGWGIYKGDQLNVFSWETSGGQTNGKDRYIKLTSNTLKFIQLFSPTVAYGAKSLMAQSIYYKGNVQKITTQYLNDAGSVLSYQDKSDDIQPNASSWTKITWASKEGGDVPAGTARIRFIIQIAPGQTASLDTAKIAYGARNAKWRNYIEAAREWASIYSNDSQYGPAIAAWQGIKEVYDSTQPALSHPFSREFYQAIKSANTTIPVGIDSSPGKAPVTDPANLYLYRDAADYYNLHIYRDDGAIPNTSSLDKPFIIGELGANNQCPNGGYPPAGCAGSKTNLANPDAEYNLNAVRAFYINGFNAGAQTVMAWSWTSNPTIAQHNKDGSSVFGNAGQWIKDWVP